MGFKLEKTKVPSCFTPNVPLLIFALLRMNLSVEDNFIDTWSAVSDTMEYAREYERYFPIYLFGTKIIGFEG